MSKCFLSAILLRYFMRKNNLLIILSIVLVASCGLLEKYKTPVDQPQSNTADNSDNPQEADNSQFENELAATANESLQDLKINDTPVPEEIVITPDHKETKEIVAERIKIYKVKKGETLMQIAFKLYGDVSRWKDLKNLNQEKISRNTLLPSNMSLKYNAPEAEFVWNPEGLKYLIKKGETLGIISNNVYQTPKKWKDIWENNKPLIKNPNVIYSGFTIYYKNENPSNVTMPQLTQKSEAPTSTGNQETVAAERSTSSEKTNQ